MTDDQFYMALTALRKNEDGTFYTVIRVGITEYRFERCHLHVGNVCPKCGELFQKTPNYCSNCGHKMGGGSE